MSNKKVTLEEAREQAQSAFGFVPNLMETIAQGNPAVVSAYLAASGALSGSVLTPAEKQIVMLATSSYNDCHYCTAAHRTALRSMGIAQAEVEAIDDLDWPEDRRLQALVEATWAVQRERGWVKPGTLDVTTEELYEIITLIGLKTITNYINHIAGTEVDAPFLAQAKRAVASDRAA